MTNSQTLVRELSAKGQLPALEANVGAICTLTEDPLTCVADLTAVILRDCSLTSNLIATANTALYGSAESVKTVSAAISTLGFDAIRSLSVGLGIVKQMSQCAQNRNLYRLFAGAYFSGMLSVALGQRMGEDAPEELFVTGLLSGLPRLLLAHAFPEKYAQMEKRVMTAQEDVNHACLDAFGVTYLDLASEIARFWNLPTNVVRILNGEERTDRSLALVRQAGQIADVMFGNARGGAEVLRGLEKKLQLFTRDPSFRVPDFVTETCSADQNTVRFFKLTSQDVEMMVRIAEWGKVNPGDVANLLSFGAASQELKDDAQEDPALIIGQLLADLTMSVRSGTEINKILLTAMEGIYRCLRPACVLVAFSNYASRRIEGRLCLGASVLASEFQVSLDENSLIAGCLAARKPVLASVSRDLPLPFLKRLNAEFLLLLPIVTLGKAIGLYLVARETSRPLTKQEETWSAALVEHVAIAFERLKSAKTP